MEISKEGNKEGKLTQRNKKADIISDLVINL
jgi:hypothetical protein